MCGLAGLVTHTPRDLAGPLAAMSAEISHRGPDGRGELFWDCHQSPSDSPLPARVGLTHRRLAIIDLHPSAAQPMTDASGRFHLVYNGEIYNYIELRRDLEARGSEFRTASDTEVLLQALMTGWEAALPRLVGMFSFALLDTQRRRLLLARDPFGIKPLYYAPWDEGFAFASEIKALLVLPGVERTAAAEPIHDYLTKGISEHREDTMFASVKQLPPGCWAELDIEDRRWVVEPRPYWKLRVGEPIEITLDDAAERLRELFLQSVDQHRRADVPVAAALSGGIDSSAIAAGLRLCGGRAAEIHTFSYIAADPALSEERWVDLAVGAVRTIPHKITIAPADLVRDLDALIQVQDEPFGSTGIYAQYRVFELVGRCGIKVSLDGQGADELFAGYRNYLPRQIICLIRAGRVSAALRLYISASRASGVRGLRVARNALYYALPASFRRRVLDIAQPGWINGRWFAQRVEAREPWPRPSSALRQTLYEDLTKYRIPRLLRYADRNAMAHSVESRVPFLTTAMVEFVYSLPDEYLVDGTALTKPVLRRALRGIVPGRILARRDKLGFETPERAWLQESRDWVDAVLRSDAASSIAAIDSNKARAQWQRTIAGKEPYDSRLWRVINLVRWAELKGVTFE